MRPFLPALFLVTIAAGPCDNKPTRPAPPPGSFLVLLCKASDAAAEPQTVAFIQQAFSKNEPELLAAYFDSISGGKLDVSGSEVFGWFTMPVTTAQLAPTVRNNTTNPNRSQTATDCRNAALPAITNSGEIVDPANYTGVITVVNVPADVGATGKNIVITSHFGSEIAFIAHEMIHVLGLPDSYRMAPDSSANHRWSQPPDSIYGDCWDIMSYATCALSFATTSRGVQGPELQAYSRKRLGWLDTTRIHNHSAFLSGPRTIDLAPLAQPHQPGMLMAEVEVLNRGRYTVEYRDSSRFDRGIFESVVLIREQRNNNRSYIVRQRNGRMEWIAGEVFTDTANFTRISIDDIRPGRARITIRTDFSATPPVAGSMCGDKFRGAVLPCPSGTTCNPRRTGQIVSTEYFCLVPYLCED